MDATETLVAVGDPRTVVRTGDGAHHRVGPAAINDAGDIAFVATDSAGAQSIVRLPGGVVVRAGDRAPGGHRFASFAGVDLGDAGYLLFHARLADGAGEGVYLVTPRGIEAVAVTGGRSPQGGIYESFGQVTLAATMLPDHGEYYRLAFTARLTDGRQALVIHPCYMHRVEVLTSGMWLGESEVDSFTISPVGFSVCCVAEVRRNGHLLRTVLIAHEGVISWGNAVSEGDEPGITRLLTPPACHLDLGFVAAELAGGRRALVLRPALDDPEVVAVTGDPALGADADVVRFGPPVASTGLSASRPYGLASAVRLSTGQRAVWAAAVHSSAPFAGHATLPVVDGDRAGEFVIGNPVPVRLTNTGMLLARAGLDGRPGLVVVDGLLG